MQNRSGGGYNQGQRFDRDTPPSYIASPAYLQGGYFDDGKHLKPELFTFQAQQVASELQRAYPRLNYSQLRRFFAKIRFIELQLQSERSFPATRAHIAALIPAAADAVNRNVAPPIFRTFIEKNADLAQKDERSFTQGLVQHFQSVVCYYPRQSGQ